MKNLIKNIEKDRPKVKWFRTYVLNRYVITILFFFVWMTFFDNNSFLVINELNGEIKKYESQLVYYKQEYEKNNDFYKKLMDNKGEKEKFARENYFMKRPNEEIFILVVDSTSAK
ncbi:FtsB family cell division protein [Riemerella columbina]|uniref:FtsB family cell division protein n=1 Tax=Riemerella columbina TaxID=103810 RepID=UPI000381532E|nr:septum formation initiator family protein [Riemerella columbina]